MKLIFYIFKVVSRLLFTKVIPRIIKCGRLAIVIAWILENLESLKLWNIILPHYDRHRYFRVFVSLLKQFGRKFRPKIPGGGSVKNFGPLPELPGENFGSEYFQNFWVCKLSFRPDIPDRISGTRVPGLKNWKFSLQISPSPENSGRSVRVPIFGSEKLWKFSLQYSSKIFI